ncbi:MAG TPA: DUF4255 domain-containing protein [Blastocatellia bacterium]|nr:DUF4255 domain-containing protein [Blastocatellia bacterium]
MSNFLAIAAVTATLRNKLQGVVPSDVAGADVTMVRPVTGAATPTVGANLYLYQVTPNVAFRNSDLPTRDSDGRLVQRPGAALDLHYLFTFYGDDSKLEPQQVLGSVIRILHAQPVITRADIQAMIKSVAGGSLDALTKSDLADSVELVKFTQLPLSLEELSKLWSVFYQIPYMLSLAFQASVVLIETGDSVKETLPVRERKVYVQPIQQPVIDQVISQAGALEPITPGSTLLVSGRRLRADVTTVQIGGLTATPSSVADTQILTAIPPGVRAGVQGLRVAQQALMGSPPTPHLAIESNLSAFVLRPAINKKPDGSYDLTVSALAIAGDGSRSATVTVKLAPNVAAGQRAALLLNESSPATPPGHNYTFVNPPLALVAPQTDTDTLTFKITGVAAGTYFVRVEVDGAESVLDRPGDPVKEGITV